MPAAHSQPTPEDFDPTQSMELVWQGQRGDTEAVNELFTRYIPRLRRILNIKIPIALRGRVDPDDVLQETLIVATRRLPDLELRNASSILNWLSKIADLCIKNRQEYLHAERRDPAREQRLRLNDESTEHGGLRLPSQDPSPSQYFAREELERMIDLHVQMLEPEDYREVVLMRDYYDEDWETIRTRLNRPSVEAVQDLYHRAHKRLQERMSRYMR